MLSSTPRSIQWGISLGILDPHQDIASQQAQLQHDYETLVQKYPFPQHETNNPSPCTSTDSLDPLTALLSLDEVTMEAEYQKGLRQNRQKTPKKVTSDEPLSSTEQAQVWLQIIGKDLARLTPPDAVYNTQVSSMMRKDLLTQLLFVLAHYFHTKLGGYQQGMHEVASYCLYVLELEGQPLNVSMAYFLCRACIVPSGYGDALTISQRISSRLQQEDAQLHQAFLDLQVPTPLLFAKWIRLLFAREIYAVLELWDVLFAQQSHALEVTLECAAVARLIRHRATFFGVDDRLHWLMNMPVEDNVEPWMVLTKTLLDPTHVSPLIVPQAASAAPPTMRFLQPTTPTTTTRPSSSSSFATPSFSAFKDTLVSHTQSLALHTQSLRKRLVDEYGKTNNEFERNYERPDYRPSLLLDPPVQSPGKLNMQSSIVTLQSYLVQQQQQQSSSVPAQVWQALATLEWLRQEHQIE